MRLWRHGWVQVCVVALVSGVATAVVAIQLRPAPESPSTPSGPASVNAGRPSAAATKDGLEKRFRVFRAPARPSDRVRVARSDERDAVGDVDARYVRENGAQPSLGRRLRRSPRVFAIPARGMVCLVHELAGGECTPAESAHRSFQVHTCGHTPRGRYELSGLVADPVRAAFLRLKNGRRVRLPVSRNFVDLTLSARSRGELPRHVELRGPNGTRRARVPGLTLTSLACGNPL